jgi:hypothetical protein
MGKANTLPHGFPMFRQASNPLDCAAENKPAVAGGNAYG